MTITTTSALAVTTGEQIGIDGVGVAGYEGEFTVTGTPSPTSFTYTDTNTGLAASGGGTVYYPSIEDYTATSKGYTPPTTGTDYWVATYNGDSNNMPISTVDNADPVTVGSLVVTSASDSSNATGNTLRQAISFAESLGGGTITFASALTGQTITLGGSLLELTATTNPITIDASSIGGITISGNKASGVFQVDTGANVTIDDLTIAQGSSDNGGGINNSGSLILNDCTLSNDIASTLGGGIQNSGALTINGSTFSDDSVTIDGEGGGGIQNDSDGTLTVSDCTFSNDSAAGGFGGGIDNLGTATVSDSTFSGNSSSYGGGICVQGGTIIADCTLAGNSAHGFGGGIYYDSGEATLLDTIVAGNTAPGDADLSGTFVSQGNNLIGNGDGSTGLTNGVDGDQVGTTANPINPLLAPLGNYGGPTQTIALLPGSPAINAGSTADVSTVEQLNIDQDTVGYVGMTFVNSSTVYQNGPGHSPAGELTYLSGLLNALPSIGGVGGSVTLTADSGPAGSYSFSVAFGGTLANSLQPLIQVAPEGGASASTSYITLGFPPATDQRGDPRIVNGTADIGAFESSGFTIADTSGDGQSATVGSPFTNPLKVTVTANNPAEPVAGGVVTYGIPTTGASAILSSETATIGSDGTASVTATANSTPGNYLIFAETTGTLSTADFSLTNTPVGPVGSLVGSSSTAVATGYNLTQLGLSDWAQFGTNGNPSGFNHKATGGLQISNVTRVGTGGFGGYTSPSYQTMWSDGTPTVSDGSEHGYVWANNSLGAGYSFTAPAGTGMETLDVYVGGFSSGSTLTAHLSNSSAPDYSVSFSGSDHYSDIVVLTYDAGAANQTLTISYTKTSNISGTNGSADLIAAWLNTGSTNTGTPRIQTNPISQSVTTGTDVKFTASATGIPTPTVQWYVSVGGGAFVPYTGAGATTDTIDTGPATLAESENQYYAVFTNSAGYADTSTATLTVNAAPTGSLTGSQSTAASSYNLTQLGTTDWAAWGRNGVASNFDHKATGGSQISNVTKVGSGGFGGFTDPTRDVTWTDGTPTASDADDSGYIWANNGIGAGYSFTVPASTTSHTLYIYLGGYSSGSTFTAHLSDKSAPDYVTMLSSSGHYNDVIAITYNAASPGQTLTLTYVKNQNINGTNGSADLIAAWLE